jgi:hypothetical protein
VSDIYENTRVAATKEHICSTLANSPNQQKQKKQNKTKQKESKKHFQKENKTILKQN